MIVVGISRKYLRLFIKKNYNVTNILRMSNIAIVAYILSSNNQRKNMILNLLKIKYGTESCM